MFFLRFILFAAPALVAADALGDVLDAFTTISSTDTAAFSLWLVSYAQVAESYYESIYKGVQSEVGAAITNNASFGSSVRAAIASMTANYDYSDFYSAIQGSSFNRVTDITEATDNVEDFTGAFSDFTDFSAASEAAAASLVVSAAESSIGLKLSSGHPSGLAWSSSASETVSGDSETGASTSVGRGLGGPRNAGSSASPTPFDDSTGSSSLNAGMGAHQAPMLIGAAMAGVSLLFL